MLELNLSGQINVAIAEVFYNVNYSVKNSTVDCKYLIFPQDFFFRLKPKQYKKCQYIWLLKNSQETHKTKQINSGIIWQETVRKIIDGLEGLGSYHQFLSRMFFIIQFLLQLNFVNSQKLVFEGILWLN